MLVFLTGHRSSRAGLTVGPNADFAPAKPLTKILAARAN